MKTIFFGSASLQILTSLELDNANVQGKELTSTRKQ